MAYKTYFLFLALMLAVLLLDARTAKACTCLRQQTVLAEYEWAKVVVIAQVVSVEKSEKGVDGIASTKMIVERVFKGRLKLGDEMIFAQGGGGSCTWGFSEKDIGKKFLFYLSEKGEDENLWYASGCGRSGHLERAADDLLYLENINKVRGKTRLSGTLHYSQPPVLEGEEWTSRTLDGRKVRVIGEKKTYELMTNHQGAYEIYDLPAGIYTVEAEAFDGWKVDSTLQSKKPELSRADRGNVEKEKKIDSQVIVEAGKHAYFDFSYTINNVIRGKVFDVAGKAMKDVCLRLVPAQGKAAEFFLGGSDCTDKDGAFEMTGIPPGGYLIVVNNDGKISSSEPFPTFYYPNVFEREKAGVIAIGAGDVREDINIYVPKMEETISVEGILLYADGKAVGEGWVEFNADNTGASTEGESRAKTDANGRFSMRILKGLQGKLYGKMYTYVGRLENCPKHDELIRKTGHDSAELQTNVVDIRADDNLSKMELKYAFPFCRKAKVDR